MCAGAGEPFVLPAERGAGEQQRNRLQRERFASYWGGRAMPEGSPLRASACTEELRTVWHARDGSGGRALCGDALAVIVTDDNELVTCGVCLHLLAVRGERGEG